MKTDVSSGECGPYNGKICKNHLDTHSVWYNLTENNFGGFINEQITTNLWNEMIVTLSEPCKLAAQVTLKILISNLIKFNQFFTNFQN